MPSSNRKLLDAILRHATFLEGFKTHEVRAIVALLERDVLPRITTRVRAGLGGSRLRDIEKEIRQLLVAGMKGLSVSTRERLIRFADQEAQWNQSQLQKAIPQSFNVPVSVVSPETLRRLVSETPIEGSLLREQFEKMGSRAAKNIRNTIRAGIVEGRSTPDIVRDLQSGPYTVAKRHAQTIVRTAVQNVSNEVRLSTMEANTDVVQAWQFVATLDARTTDICMSHDGKVYRIGTGSGSYPPLHMQCRSTAVPILKSWKELGIPGLANTPAVDRASMNGLVPAHTTYGPWLRQQPIQFQNMVLGVGRAKAFRRGTVKIENFSALRRGKNGLTHRGVSLQELKAIENGKKVSTPPSLRSSVTSLPITPNVTDLFTKRETQFLLRNGLFESVEKAKLTPRVVQTVKIAVRENKPGSARNAINRRLRRVNQSEG